MAKWNNTEYMDMPTDICKKEASGAGKWRLLVEEVAGHF